MEEVHLTHLFLVIGGQNYKKMWKHSVSVVRSMIRKKINPAQKISDVYLGEDEIETSWDSRVIFSFFPSFRNRSITGVGSKTTLLNLCIMPGFQI